VFRSSLPELTRGRCKTAFVKSQKGYTCRALWSFGRKVPTLLREYRALTALAAIGIPVPEVLDFSSEGDSARLVLAGLDNVLQLNAALERFPAESERILERVAHLIRAMHQHRWNHGALYPEHILVSEDNPHTVTLIDLEKADRSVFHGADLDRLVRYLNLDSPDLARWFDLCYAQAPVLTHEKMPGGHLV
jgi:tRNA A-37 threonylcarbamoyl transferase component Bud32